jgi:hypothetical protein
MNRLAYVIAAYAVSVGMLWAQQPAGGAPTTPAPNPPEPGGTAAAVAPPDAGRGPKAGNGLSTERGRRRDGVQGGQQGVPGAFMERLRQEHPEIHKRLSKLYQEDREQFFQEVRALMRERGLQAPEGTGSGSRSQRDSVEEQKCSELGRRFRESKDAAEKERLKTELAAAIQAAFEARLRGSQERIARLEQQLKEFRQRLEHLEANRDKICAERLDELTKPAELRWDGNW